MPWFGGLGPGWGYPFSYPLSPWGYRPWWGWPYWRIPPWGAYPPFWGAPAPEAELAAMRARAEWLRGELEAIERRIQELEATG